MSLPFFSQVSAIPSPGTPDRGNTTTASNTTAADSNTFRCKYQICRCFDKEVEAILQVHTLVLMAWQVFIKSCLNITSWCFTCVLSSTIVSWPFRLSSKYCYWTCRSQVRLTSPAVVQSLRMVERKLYKLFIYEVKSLLNILSCRLLRPGQVCLF